MGTYAYYTCLHDFYQLHKLVHVFPGGHEPLQHKELEVVIHVAANTSHHLYHHINDNVREYYERQHIPSKDLQLLYF